MIIHYFLKGICPAIMVAMAALLVSGCETAYSPTREDIGTVAGGAAGVAIGSQIGGGSGRTAAMIGGAVLGGLAGRAIGRHMDEQDRSMAAQALETRETHESTTWTNPDTGHEYTMTPTRTYDEAGRPCRDFVTEAIIDGRQETLRGTACRQADGSWQVVES